MPTLPASDQMHVLDGLMLVLDGLKAPGNGYRPANLLATSSRA